MDGHSRAPKPKPLASGRLPASGGKAPAQVSGRVAKVVPPTSAHKPPVKQLRIEPEQEPLVAPQFLQPKDSTRAPQRISSRTAKPEPHPAPKRISGPAAKAEAQPAPKRISGPAAKPVTTEAGKPQITPEKQKATESKRVEAKPAEPNVAEPKAAEAKAPAPKVAEAKAESARQPKAPSSWISKKTVAALLGVAVLLLGTAVALAVKIHMQKQNLAQGERHNDGDSTDSGSSGPGENIVRHVKLSTDPQLPRRRLSSHSNLLLAAGGSVPSGGVNPQFINDGNSTNYDGNAGYAYSDNNNPKDMLVVTLKEPAEMNRIRVLLWDRDERTYRYILSVSPDGTNFNPVQDNSKKESRSWQQVKFPTQKVKAVGVRGVGDANGHVLHVVEIEAFNDVEPSNKVTRRTPPRGPVRSAGNLRPGIWAEYFDGIDFYANTDDTPELARAQENLNFCASTPPPANQPTLHNWPFYGPCAAIFSGYVKVEKPGLHTIFLESENGSRLFIDGTLLVDNDGDHGLQESWEQIDLAAGLHRIWIEYYTLGYATGLNVAIKPKGDTRDMLSSKMLFYDPAECGEVSAPKSANMTERPQVKFLSRDDKRGGVWHKDLGKDGYVIFNKNGGGQHLQKLPPYILALNSFADHCVWQVGKDERGLEEPAGGGQRLCSCEYSGNDVVIEIKAARNFINRLSLYCLDFDPCQRKQKVQFSDGDKVLHEMDVGDMAKGTWLHYEVAGSLTLRLQNLTATNAVIAGVFWDSDKGVHFRTPTQGQPTNDNVKPGVVSEYFDGLGTYPTDEDVPTLTRLEPTILFGGNPPPSGGRMLKGWPLADVCAALFYGCIKVPQDEKYTFVLESDDGSHLYIDGAKLIDDDGSHPMKKVEGSIDLKAGLHRIWVDWYNGGGQMGLNLFMKKDGKEVPIPAEMLFHE